MPENVNKIKVCNERLWEHAQNGDNIDLWLQEQVGYGNWKEWFGLTALPYRSFSFRRPEDEAIFVLRWC